jgi:hypothetical protein
MGYWICHGEIYAYDPRRFNDTVFKNWYEFCIRPHRLKGKDFLMLPCENINGMEIKEVDWELQDDGTLFYFNRRHVHFMQTFSGLIIRSLIVIQRYTRRCILHAHVNAHAFSKLSAFSHWFNTALPGDIIDNIISLTFHRNQTSKITQSQPVIIIETDAFKQRLRGECHFHGTIA